MAQVTKSTVIFGWKDQPCSGETVAAFFQMTAVHLNANATQWCCLCSRQRWRPNQLWGEILWLTSAACAVNAVYGPTATPAGDTRLLHVESHHGNSTCDHRVSLLHCQIIYPAPPSRGILISISRGSSIVNALFFSSIFTCFRVDISVKRNLTLHLFQHSPYNIWNMKYSPIWCNNNAERTFLYFIRFIKCEILIFVKGKATDNKEKKTSKIITPCHTCQSHQRGAVCRETGFSCTCVNKPLKPTSPFHLHAICALINSCMLRCQTESIGSTWLPQGPCVSVTLK